MKEIQLDVELKEFPNQKVVQVKLDSISSNELCLMLSLLKEKLIDTFEIRFNNLSLFLSATNEKRSVCTLLEFRKGAFKGKITNDALDYFQYFLLEYYRDEIGEAEHIDIDFSMKDGEECTLVIKCAVYKEYSADQINKMIGL